MNQYALWLQYVPKLGSISLLKIWEKLSENPSLSGIDKARYLYEMEEGERSALFAEVLGRHGEAVAAGFGAVKPPEALAEELVRQEIGYVSMEEEDYPERLKGILNRPFGLFYKGRLPGREKTAGIVGARMSSSYGREQASKFGLELGKAGISVVSGMARGIDSVAQRYCLNGGAPSYAVLGCGVDICYPDVNKDLYEKLLWDGGIVSEYLPGTPAEARLFPARNRIIAGLSDVLLLVEAKERSGSLITMQFALEQGREIYCVPGRNGDALSVGCNRLIREGAGIATCPDDLIEALLGVKVGGEDEQRSLAEFRMLSMQEPEKTIYAYLLRENEATLAELVRHVEDTLHRTFTGPQLQQWMTILEVKGFVTELGYGRYAAKKLK